MQLQILKMAIVILPQHEQVYLFIMLSGALHRWG